jgi:hypothetical protein
MAAEITSIGWDTPSMDATLSQALRWTTMIGLFLASMFWALKLGYEYFKYSLGALQGNNVNVMWDWQEMSRVFLIITMIGMYTPLATGFTSAVSQINSITQTDSSVSQKLQKTANDYYVKSKKAGDSEKNKKLKEQLQQAKNEGNEAKINAIEKIIERRSVSAKDPNDYATTGTVDGANSTQGEQTMSLFTLDPAEWLLQAFNGLVLVIGTAIKWVVGLLLKIVFKVGIAFGPIVLAFGIIFRDKPIQFFNQILTIGFVFTTLNLLDIMYMYFIAEYTVSDMSVSESISVNLGMIGCYLSAFKITTWFVGQSGMNSIMNKAVAAGGAIVATAVMGGAALAGGAGAVGGAMGGITGGGSGGSMAAGRVAGGVKNATKEDRMD